MPEPKQPKLHTLVLTSDQLDTVRTAMQMVAEQIDWAVGNLKADRPVAQRLRDSASAVRSVTTEHLYSTGGTPPACERNGCPHVLDYQATPDDYVDLDDRDLPPLERLVVRLVELVDQVDKVESMAKYLTQDAAMDVSHLTGKPATPEDPDRAELIQRMAGISGGDGERVKLVRLMELSYLRSYAYSVRSALRMLRLSQRRRRGQLKKGT